MADNKQDDGSIKAVVGDQPGSFKGGLGTTAITTTPVDRVSKPSEPTKGLGSAQIAQTPAPKAPPATPTTNQP
jgi:hypothetical protein